jgi:hypothetical protein
VPARRVEDERVERLSTDRGRLGAKIRFVDYARAPEARADLVGHGALNLTCGELGRSGARRRGSKLTGPRLRAVRDRAVDECEPSETESEGEDEGAPEPGNPALDLKALGVRQHGASSLDRA